MSENENILLQETNRGGYTLSIIAKFVERYPVQYIIRVSKPKSKPKGTEVDFVSNLEGFKNIGELRVRLIMMRKTLNCLSVRLFKFFNNAGSRDMMVNRIVYLRNTISFNRLK